MTLFCFACHRSFDEELTSCPQDSFQLVESNFEYPPEMQIDEYSLAFEACLFPGEHTRIYRTRDSKTGNGLLLETYASQIIDNNQFEKYLAKASQVNVDGVASCLKYGALDSGVHYVLSEYPYGKSITTKLDEPGAMSSELTVHIINQTLVSLIALRNKGLFEGNLMPANCLIAEDDNVPNRLFLTGVNLPEECFNQEKSAQTGFKSETVSALYVSPERFTGGGISEASEVYAVGALMFECLTGIPAFSGRTMEEVRKKHQEEQLLPLRGLAPELDIPALLDSMVLKALSKAPSGRFGTYELMQKELLFAAKESRIYLPGSEKSKYQPSVFAEQSSEPPEVHEEIDYEAKRVAEKEAKIKEEEKEIDEEIQAKVKDLSKSFSMLSVVALIVVIGAASILLYQGSDEDKGPLWVKLIWEQQMSSADSSMKAGKYAEAILNYEQALNTSDGIKDSDERAVKSLNGLLKAYEGNKDTAKVSQTRRRLEEIEKSHLQYIEKE